MKKKFFLTSALIISALIIAGCQPVGGPSGTTEKSADDMIKDGMKKLSDIDAYSFDLSAKVDLKAPEGEKPDKVNLNLQMKGASDMISVNDPRLNMKINGDITADQDGYSGEAELRMNKDALYANVIKVEAKGTLQTPEQVTQAIGKWWKLPIPPEAWDELNKVVPHGSDANLTEKQKKLKQAFEETKFFHNAKFVDMQNINNEESYHYTAQLDKQALASFIYKAAELEGTTLTSSEKSDIESGLKRFDFNADIYVAKASGIMHKLNGTANLIGTRVEPTGTIGLEFTIGDVNKAVNVEVPTPVQEVPLEMLLMPLMYGTMGSPVMNPPNATPALQ